MALTKPVLRGMFIKDMKSHFSKAFVVAVVATVAYKMVFYNKKEKEISDFHKSFDMEKDFERKMKAGVFQCVDSNGVIRPIQ